MLDFLSENDILAISASNHCYFGKSGQGIKSMTYQYN